VVSPVAELWRLLPSRVFGAASGRERELTSGWAWKMAKKKAASASPKLTEGEQDLLSHMHNGYQLETNSLGGDPILRRLKDSEVVRPLAIQ